MPACCDFHNLTLGYERHPAVHHLDGAVETGALIAVVGPNGAGKSTLFKGIVGALKPLAGSIERDGARRPRHRLPAASRRHRPLVSDQRVRHGGDGAVADAEACSAASAARIITAIEAAIAAVGLTGFEQRSIGTLSGGQLQRMLFARAAAAGRPRDRARRAVHRHRRQDLGRPAGSGAALARRTSHRACRHCTTSISSRANFPQRLLLAREPVAWGATREVLTAENLNKARRCARRSTKTPRPARPARRPRRHAVRQFLIAPFADISSSCAVRWPPSLRWRWAPRPIGVFLMLRRMSLIGDAMSHAILPGAPSAFSPPGLSLSSPWRSAALIAGLLVALGAGADRAGDASCRKMPRSRRFFLVSLALGVTIVTRSKAATSNADDFLVRLVLAIDEPDAVADRQHHLSRSSRWR